MVQRETGVLQVLAKELHPRMPGNPADLLSGAGIHLLETNFPVGPGKGLPKAKPRQSKARMKAPLSLECSRLL